MKWFGKRSEAVPPGDPLGWIAGEARRAFAEHGVETTIQHGERPADVMLLASDGRRFPLYNLLARVAGLSQTDARRAIEAHVRALAAEPSTFEPSFDELRSIIRTRVISNRDMRPGEPSFDYARPFADGVVVALCLDRPETVQIMTDTGIADAGWDLDQLYRWGQANTDGEPVDEHDVLDSGIHVLAGESFFVASKAANLAAALPVTKFGTVFAIPHRHMLLALPLGGPDPVSGVQHLAALTRRILGDPLPGGLVSTDLFFSRQGSVSRVSETDADGAVSILVGGAFHGALEEIVGREE